MKNIIRSLILIIIITPFAFGMERVEHNDQENQQEIISIKSVAIKSTATGEFIRAVDGKGYYVYRTGTEIEPWHKFRLITLRSLDEFTSEVALKSEFSGKYAGIKSTKDPVLVAISNEISDNQKFLLYDMGENRIALESIPIKKFVRINEGNNLNLIADSSGTNEKETFELVDESLEIENEPQSGDESVMQAEPVESLDAEPSDESNTSEGNEYGIDEGIEDRINSGDGDQMAGEPVDDMGGFPVEDSTDAAVVQSEEFLEADPQTEFENIVLPEKIALQSVLSNKYVRAGVGKGSFLAAVSDNINGWAEFNLVQLGDGVVVLQSAKSGKFVKPYTTGDTKLVASADSRDEAYNFKIVQLGENNIALQSLETRKYLRAGVGKHSYLAVVSDNIKRWQTFRLIDLNHQ